MTTKKKYYYRKLKPEEGRQYLINAFSKGSTLTLWESGNVDKKVTIEFSFKDPNAKSLSIVVDDNSLPKEWRHASLLYHLIDSSFSFLGKVLSESSPQGRILTFDNDVFVMDKRQFFRLDVWGRLPFYLRLKFINPPIHITERKDNVFQLWGNKDPLALWASFLDFVKKVAPATENTNEVFVNYPIIDISTSGVAIPVTKSESDFLSSIKQIDNAATIFFAGESIDVPRLNYVHTTPWSFPNSTYGLKAGFNFADDLWVRKQIENKIKVHIESVEGGFDSFLK